MARCPFAIWRPLAAVQPPKMRAHNRSIGHTMGGNSLEGTDRVFKDNGYGGTESHFGVGAAGLIYQWTDTDHMADANVDANDDSISWETADAGAGFSKWSGSDVPAWTDAQLEAIVRLNIWICDTHDIPKVMLPDSRAGGRGIGAHRQGINSSPAGQAGYRKPGTETWSLSLGKVCPGDRRFAQLKSIVIPAVAQGGLDMDLTPANLAQIGEAVWTFKPTGYPFDAYRYLRDGSDAPSLAEITAMVAAAIAAIPPSQGGAAPTVDEIAAAVAVKFSTLLGGTS